MQPLVIIALLGIISSRSFAQENVALPSSVSAESPVTLKCGQVQSIETNKTLEWMYTNPQGAIRIIPNAVNISLNATTDAGNYSCTYDGAQRAFYIVGNFTAPTFMNARTSVTYNDGDHNRKLTCESAGTYPVPTFQWLRRGSLDGEIPMVVSSDTNPNYQITTNGTKSVLKFQNVTYEEAQTFICEATNFAGNGSVELLVRVKNRYAAVWPFLGIVAEVVILIVIILVYEKRSKKADVSTPDEPPAEDEKPLNRDEGVEIRNRHSNK